MLGSCGRTNKAGSPEVVIADVQGHSLSSWKDLLKLNKHLSALGRADGRWIVGSEWAEGLMGGELAA